VHSRTKRRSTAGTSRRRSSYTPGTPSRRARVSADAAAAAASAADLHVTEKLQVLEVCVCLKVHRKVLRKVLRQDRRPEQLSQEYKFINNSNNSNKPNNSNKNTDRLTFK
jgi:hypothetical protein